MHRPTYMYVLRHIDESTSISIRIQPIVAEPHRELKDFFKRDELRVDDLFSAVLELYTNEEGIDSRYRRLWSLDTQDLHAAPIHF